MDLRFSRTAERAAPHAGQSPQVCNSPGPSRRSSTPSSATHRTKPGRSRSACRQTQSTSLGCICGYVIPAAVAPIVRRLAGLRTPATQIPSPRQASPEPTVPTTNNMYVRPCPHCTPGNQYGWRCPQPIADPDVDPNHAWPAEEGNPPGHGVCGNWYVCDS